MINRLCGRLGAEGNTFWWPGGRITFRVGRSIYVPFWKKEKEQDEHR